VESKAKKKKVTKKKASKAGRVKTVEKVPVDAKDNLDKVERVIYSLEGKFLHIVVGNHERPAEQEDIDDIDEKITELFEKHKVNALAFVTHHGIEVHVHSD
tara:strand:+ start:1237 stop:1539 length:303 start_codon:yes stop_codon:yes gene_type:complete